MSFPQQWRSASADWLQSFALMYAFNDALLYTCNEGHPSIMGHLLCTFVSHLFTQIRQMHKDTRQEYSLQIGDWITKVDEGRTKAMSRARPRALQHLKQEDEQFWDTEPEKRRAPPVLDLKEAQGYHEKPLVLPKIVDKKKSRSSSRQQGSA